MFKSGGGMAFAEASENPEAMAEQLFDRARGVAAVRYGGGLTAMEEDMDRLHEQLNFFTHTDQPVPCLLTQEHNPLPVDSTDIVGPVSHWSATSWKQELGPSVRRQMQALAERSHMGYDEFHPEDVLGFMKHRIMTYLTTFVDGGGRTKSREPTFLGVSVHTDLPGLTIDYSPAYLLRSQVHFGGPTDQSHDPPEPGLRRFFARGPLSPGQWRFFVKSYHVPVTLDPGLYNVPPIRFSLEEMRDPEGTV